MNFHDSTRLAELDALQAEARRAAKLGDEDLLADLKVKLEAVEAESRIRRERLMRESDARREKIEDERRSTDRAITTLCWVSLGLAAATAVISMIVEANTTTVVYKAGFDGGEVDLGI